MGNLRQYLYAPVDRPFLNPEPEQGYAVPDGQLVYATAVLSDLAYYTSQPQLAAAVQNWGGWENVKMTQAAAPLPINYLSCVDPNGCLFSFAGTENWAQILAYSLTCKTIHDRFINQGVHLGFLGLMHWMLSYVREDLENVPKGTPLVLTGHSLGGAVALLMAAQLFLEGEYPIKNVVTFGQPCVSNSLFEQIANRLPLTQVRNAGDLVPFLPNSTVAIRNIPGLIQYLFFGWDQPGPSFVLFENGNLFPWQPSQFSLLPDIVLQLITDNTDTAGHNIQANIDSLWFTLHRITTSVTWLEQRVRRQGGVSDFAALHNLVQLAEAIRYRDRGPQNALSNDFLSTVLYFTPNANTPLPLEPNDPPPLPPVPSVETRTVGESVDVNRVVDATTFDNNILLPGNAGSRYNVVGSPRADWFYRGKDRNLLVKLEEVMNGIVERDGAAENPTPTERLSNRQPIIDPANAALVDAFWDLKSQVDMLVSMER